MYSHSFSLKRLCSTLTGCVIWTSIKSDLNWAVRTLCVILCPLDCVRVNSILDISVAFREIFRNVKIMCFKGEDHTSLLFKSQSTLLCNSLL